MILNDLIFVSSGGTKLDTLDFIDLCSLNEVHNIELSSGTLIESEEIIKHVKQKKITLQPHNYFPPQKNRYIINLAKKSICNDKEFKSILDSQIKIAKKFKRQYLHFHAGYCLDLKAKDLGSEKLKSRILNRSECKDNLYENSDYIVSILKKHELSLLIENNVLNQGVFSQMKANPFLCCDPEEILDIFINKIPETGLLLDLAHLKVSSHTLKFDFFSAVKSLVPITKAVHISDNNGQRDSNEAFDEDSDVLKALNFFGNLNFITIEVYDDNIETLKKQINLVKKIRTVNA